ncbi:MAG TPA: sulfotransferase [Allosphingosinicella sp.]|nr:sulfotransferase [Allosphingosinicella sp.]
MTDLRRLRAEGFQLQASGRHAEAAERYETVVAQAPEDWEIWNNLGNARRAAGDLDGAIAALSKAAALRPAELGVQFNFASALVDAGRRDEAAETLVAAGQSVPDEAPGLLDLARALSALVRYDEAESLYRRAPSHEASWLERGQMLERGNRLDRLPALIAEAEARGLDLPYLNALALDRDGRAQEALQAALAIPANEVPARRAALIGRLADKAGEADRAFAAYGEMNALAEAASPGARNQAAAYRAHVAAIGDMLTEGYAARWRPVGPGERPSPVFLVGFPRSGTTLLDTLLMGHPALNVLEEVPLLERAASALGDFQRLPELDEAETERLRDLYFDALGPVDGRTVIDKLPLNLLGAPLIHRLFPDAKFIFAARHPCDVVLSCFMQPFDLNAAMANFLDLTDAARLYALALSFWERARAILLLDVYTLRYEDLVEDKEREMRALIAFLGLVWDDRVLDNQATAIERGPIKTPSYAQVAQPIYQRARGRWERYRAHMAPVLPILAPWAEKLGYST